MRRLRVGVITSHPIQYQAPWFRALARHVDLHVFFAHRASPDEQAKAGFGVSFDWDTDLTSGYDHSFLNNVARVPGADHFQGCNTPDIHNHLTRASFDAFIVNGWYLRSYIQAMRACWRSKIPVLLRGDSQLPGQRSVAKRAAKFVALRMLFARVQGFLSVGQRFTEFLRHYGVNPALIFAAPHCVDNDWFSKECGRTRDEQVQLKSKMGIRPEQGVLLFVGKLVSRKRPLDLVRAAEDLNRRGIDVRLVFVGDGPMKDRIEQEARRGGIPLNMAGFINQSRMPMYYGMSSVLILPSDASESWGLVVNETMACGKPAVVCEQAGCAPDMIREGLTGYTFPLGNRRMLSDCLERILSWPSGEQHEYAIRNVVARHSIQNSVNGVLEALAHVCR